MIRSLGDTPFDTLAAAFAAAFAEYEVQITAAELRTMLRRRGFDPALSFATLNESGDITAFTLNGVGMFGGVRTAYDTGTGTLPAYRGTGLATRIFEESLPHLRAAGVQQYLLEVLQHNTAAISVYRKLGFEVVREFNYYRGIFAERATSSTSTCSSSRGSTSCTSPRLIPSTKPNLQLFEQKSCNFFDFEPSWQNSFEAIQRALDDFVLLGAFDGDRLVGYIVFEPASGDITQIAVSPSHRRRGIGTTLLGEALRRDRAEGVKCINTEVGRDEALAAFLEARGIRHAGRQFEMIRKL